MSDTNSRKIPPSPPSSPASPGELQSESEGSPKQFGPCSPPFLITEVSIDVNDVIDPLTGETNPPAASTSRSPPNSSPLSNPPSPVTGPPSSHKETGPAVPHNQTDPFIKDTTQPAEGGEIEFDRFDHPRIRLDTLHMRGTDDMSDTDVSQYFLAFGKVSLEWVNDNSCNVRFKDKHTATQALFSVGYKPLESMVGIQQQRENNQDSGVSSNEETPEIMVEVNPWRVALPHFKNSDIRLRYATTADRKQPGSATRSRYYLKYGNPHQGDTRPDHLLSTDGKDRKRQVKKRLGSQINVLNIEMDPNLEGYIADIESSEQTPSKFLKLYSDHRGHDQDSSSDSDNNFICVAKSSVDLRTKLNAKSKFPC